MSVTFTLPARFRVEALTFCDFSGIGYMVFPGFEKRLHIIEVNLLPDDATLFEIRFANHILGRRVLGE